MRAHPRSRGENARSLASRACRAGSSPLTRGKPRSGGHPDGDGGLIPAHAGKTRRMAPTTLQGAAHPRSRGENVGDVGQHFNQSGSSPLTRGKLDTGPGTVFQHRLIPAHAGKTRRLRVSARPGWAHPRSRGENDSRVNGRVVGAGSSPLTRGKLTGRRNIFLRGRLIPAHAGKTSFRWCLSLSCPAHPRSRGENPSAKRAAAAGWGSSPLTRGKRVSKRALTRG